MPAQSLLRAERMTSALYERGRWVGVLGNVVAGSALMHLLASLFLSLLLASPLLRALMPQRLARSSWLEVEALMVDVGAKVDRHVVKVVVGIQCWVEASHVDIKQDEVLRGKVGHANAKAALVVAVVNHKGTAYSPSAPLVPDKRGTAIITCSEILATVGALGVRQILINPVG